MPSSTISMGSSSADMDAYASVPLSTPLETDSIGISDSGHSSVKRTIKAIKDKGAVLYDVQVGDIIASKPDQVCPRWCSGHAYTSIENSGYHTRLNGV